MKLWDLKQWQIEELKQSLLLEREGSVSYEDLCRCDELVTNDELYAKWGDTEFVEDDFCGGGNELEREEEEVFDD